MLAIANFLYDFIGVAIFMNYNLMAKLMPLMMNKIIFDYLKSDGIKVDFAFKKNCFATNRS